MLDDAIFKPGKGLVSSITGRVLFPKAFGVAGYGVFDFKTGQLLITEDELRRRANSALPIDDFTNPYNKLIKLFPSIAGFGVGGGRPLVLPQADQITYRRPTIKLENPPTNVDADVDPPEEREDMIGMLIQPYTYLNWGGIDLDPQWFRNIQWDWGEDETPGGITFTLDPMAPFAELPMGEDGQGAEIYVEFGYTDKRKLSGTFIHTGSTIRSGNDMTVDIEGSHKTFTADQTPARNRYFSTPGSNIKYFRHIEEVNSPYKLKFDIKVSDESKYKFKTSSQAETDWRYTLRMNQAYGLSTNYSFSKDADVVIRPAGLSKREGPTPAKKEGEADHKETFAFYLGPGLITTMTRKVVARKVSSPPPKEKTATESNATVDVKKAPAKDPIREFIKNKLSGASNSIGALKDTQVVETEKIKDKKAGDPTGPAADPNVPLTPSESKDSEEKSNELEKETNENKEEKLEMGQVELDTDFLMVPRVVGIKPGDIIVIMWMEADDYKNQDFLVKTVNYAQEGAMYRVSISASRWLKDEPMVENWDELLADMEAKGLLDGQGESHGDKLYGEITEYYPRFQNWVRYYWGEF